MRRECVRDITERRTFTMECTRNLGGREVEGVLEFIFRDRQHPFHSRHGAVFSWRLFEVFKNLANELRVLDRRGPHWASNLSKYVCKRLSWGRRGPDTSQNDRLT